MCAQNLLVFEHNIPHFSNMKIKHSDHIQFFAPESILNFYTYSEQSYI